MRLAILLSLAALSSAATIAIVGMRLSNQPLLKPTPGFASAGVFNPAAIKSRIQKPFCSSARKMPITLPASVYAESSDGLHFTARPQPVLSPEASYEKNGGVEDPRLVQINGTYYLTYTAYDGHSAQLCLASSTDLINWNRKGIILPAYKGTWNTQWTKSGAIVPNQINGQWWMYYLGTRTDADGKVRDHMGLAQSSDLLHWKDATDQPVLDRRPNAFDSRVMEPGPAPIITPAGILLLYNGANDRLVYSPGWVLFDKQDPRKVIARADAPFIVPTLRWELGGQVPNVIFLEGAVVTFQKGNRLALTGYYGAADKYIGAMDIRIHLAE